MEAALPPRPEITQNMTIENKMKVLDVITTLRTYQLIGIVEARHWVEFLFPEFALFRDQEADQMFGEIARLSAGRNENKTSSE